MKDETMKGKPIHEAPRALGPDRTTNPRRRRGRRRRSRRNPWGLDKQAALGLGAVGAALGVASAFATAAADRAWSRALIGAATGGGAGAVLGALLPKGSNRNPLENPIGTTTAVLAGAALALGTVAVASRLALPKAAGRTAAPTVRGKMGVHAVDVFRNGPTWAWRAPGIKVGNESMAGAGDTRRDAIVNAYSDLVIGDLQASDRITLDYFPEQFQVQVSDEGAGWQWRSTTGETGSATSRGDALNQALDWVDAHSEID